ncbi:MAG: putative metal-binding motif-containing protein [Pseudomonadota bacterium]
MTWLLVAACEPVGAQNQDADRDGYTTTVDCDDTDARVHPGAVEICEDGVDQDCDGSDLVCATNQDGSVVNLDSSTLDRDGGIGDPDSSSTDQDSGNAGQDSGSTSPDAAVEDEDQDGYTVAQGDCDDRDSTVHPGAIEIPFDSTDQDCDGEDEVAPAELEVAASNTWSVEAAGGSGGHLAVYQHYYMAQPAVFGRRLDGNGQPMAQEFNVNRAPDSTHMAYDPDVATDGSRYLAVWSESVTSGQNTTHHIYGQWVALNGTLTGSALVIATSTLVLATPAVASNGAEFLVVWSKATSAGGSILQGRVIQSNGSMTSPVDLYSPPDSAARVYQPDAASDGTGFFTVFGSDFSTTADPGNVGGALVSASGTLTGFVLSLSLRPGAQLTPQVAYSGDRYLMITGDSPTGMVGQYIGQDGSILGSTATENFELCTACVRRLYPSLAALNTSFGALWLDDRFSSPRAVFGRRLGTVPTEMGPELPVQATSHTLKEVRVFEGLVTSFALGVRETDGHLVSFRIRLADLP